MAVIVVPDEAQMADAVAAVEPALAEAIAHDGRLTLVDLLVAAGGEAGTAPLLPGIASHLKTAKEAYENLDLAVAAKEYFEVARLMLEDPAGTQPAALARAYTLAGAAHLLNGEKTKAASAFHRAVVVGRSYSPDPNELSPDIITAYRDAKKSAMAGPKGQLTVSANVSPASVVVDGVDAGVTPVTVKSLPIGRHHVRVACRGQKPWGTVVEVQEGKTAVALADLHPLPEATRFRKAVELAAAENSQPKPGPGIRELGATLKARYIVLGVAKSSGKDVSVELSAYDLEPATPRRAAVLKKTVQPGTAGFGEDTKVTAAQLVDGLLHPALAATVVDPSVPITQRAWFWPVVGGVGAAVVVGATLGIILATRSHDTSTPATAH